MADNTQQSQHNNSLDEIIKQRYADVDEIRQMGVTPYPNRCEKTISCLDAKNSAEGAEVATAGRVIQLRLMGKAAFAHLRDFSGRVQLYIAKDQLGDEPYQFFKKHIAVGDFVQVKGHVFVTKTGEKTI